MPSRLHAAALAAPLALLVIGCGGGAETTATLAAEQVVLFPDDPSQRTLGELVYSGGVALSSSDARFGGWSAMEISEDGARLLAISDSATWMTARLLYGEDGDLTGLSDMVITPILDEDGRPLEGVRADAEGLADLGDGRYAVSFERDHRIWVYDIGADWSGMNTALPEPMPAPPGADRLRNNAGTEALVRSGSALWAAIEYPIVEGQPHTLWRYDLAEPSAVPVSRSVALTSGFGLTALARDGEDGLIIIERFWRRGVGNRIRIGRLEAGALEAAGDPAAPALLAALEPDMSVDNFEAVALIEIEGERRLFILSDDNFNARQRTLLLSFTWPQG